MAHFELLEQWSIDHFNQNEQESMIIEKSPKLKIFFLNLKFFFKNDS